MPKEIRMATTVDLRQERQRLWERAKDINDAAEAESRDFTAEEEANWTKVNADITALDKRIARQEQLEATRAEEAQMQTAVRTDGAAAMSDDERTAKTNAAFRSWILGGMAALDAEERALVSGLRADLSGLSPAEKRALSVGVDTAGGFLVPDDFRAQIEQAMLYFGGMRESGAEIMRTNTGVDIPMPVGNDTGNKGRLIGENVTVSQTDPTVGQKVLKAWMYSSDMVLVPYTLLQDSAINVESYLSGLLGERLGRITNEHFTTGSGADRPAGICTDAVTGKTIAAANAIAADELLDLEHSVDRAYRNARCRWMMSDATLLVIRKLKDGDGRYLYQPAPTAGGPTTIDGYSYVVNNDMPSLATTGNKAILFGDFSYYKIRDVIGVTMVVLRERFADSLQVGIFAYSRHDGKLIDAGGNPVKAIVVP